jgi:hypothetical protein
MVSGARRARLEPLARWVIGVVAVVLVGWIIASGVVLWSARQHTDDGLDALERARAQIDGSGLLRGDAAAALRDAERAFADAHSLADGPVLAPWRVIPLLGNNVDSVESLTDAAEGVAAVGERAADEAGELLDATPTTGAERLELLQDLADVTRRAERSLQGVDLGDDFFLVAPLGDARERFVERFDQIRSALTDATAAAEGVERLLRGPRKYLVLAANNAEMRAGSGMMLSAGVATFQDGEFSLGEMRPTPDFNLPAGAVDVPPELEELWGFTPVGRDWRWLATSPRFDVTGPLAADMWEAATGERVDGVLAVDPVVVQALLDAQGPIVVDGRELTGDDVVEYLLLEQYGLVDTTDPEQIARRDQLSTVARAAVDTLNTRPWDTEALVRELSRAGKGRHALAWARDPTEQAAWEAAGIGGQLHDDSLAVSLLNTGGNKLDQFVDVDARLRIMDDAAPGKAATVTLRFHNTAPTDLAPYVGGPHAATDLTAGEYQALVAVNSPGAGTVPEVEGLDTVVAQGPDGPTNMTAAGPLRLAPGARATVEVRFVVPDTMEELVVEPSARLPRISWRFRGERWEDSEAHRVDL